jgi:hypothetical protein
MNDKCEAYVLVGNASHRIKVQCIRLEHEGVEHEAMIPAFVDPEYQNEFVDEFSNSNRRRLVDVSMRWSTEYAYVRERGSMRIVSTDYAPPKPAAAQA